MWRRSGAQAQRRFPDMTIRLFLSTTSPQRDDVVVAEALRAIASTVFCCTPVAPTEQAFHQESGKRASSFESVGTVSLGPAVRENRTVLYHRPRARGNTARAHLLRNTLCDVSWWRPIRRTPPGCQQAHQPRDLFANPMLDAAAAGGRWVEIMKQLPIAHWSIVAVITSPQ